MKYQINKKSSFNDWYKKNEAWLQQNNKADTTSYNLRRAYDIAPQEQLDAFVTDPKAHLNSFYFNKEGVGEFVKSKNHPTVNLELDFYNGNTLESKDFRNRYDLKTVGNYYQYVPKTKPVQQVVKPIVQPIQQVQPSPIVKENWTAIQNPITYNLNGRTMYSTEDKMGELFKEDYAKFKAMNVSDEVANKLIKEKYKIGKKDITFVPDDATQQNLNNRIKKNQKGGIMKYQNPSQSINTSNERIFNPVTGKTEWNRNAQMGLEPVSPELMLLTGGVGALSNKAITTAGKIGAAALHGVGQGAMANVSNLSGSEQNISGLATDILGGAIAGGIIKGTPIATNYLKGQYYKHTFDPMKVNLQRYKGLVAPDDVMGIVDKMKVKHLSKKIDKLSKKSAEWDEVEPYEYKKADIKSQNKLKAVSKAIHSPTSQVGKSLGEGGFGQAYQFKYNPDHVVKFGRAAEVDQPLKLPELGKQFADDPNIAIPLRVEQIAPGKYATVMKKMEGVNKFKMNSIPRSSVAEAALKIRALNKSGIGFDYIGDNMLFDPVTKKISLIDLNVLPDNYTNSDWFTTHVNMAGQNPVTLLKNKLSENLQRKTK